MNSKQALCPAAVDALIDLGDWWECLTRSEVLALVGRIITAWLTADLWHARYALFASIEDCLGTRGDGAPRHMLSLTPTFRAARYALRVKGASGRKLNARQGTEAIILMVHSWARSTGTEYYVRSILDEEGFSVLTAHEILGYPAVEEAPPPLKATAYTEQKADPADTLEDSNH